MIPLERGKVAETKISLLPESISRPTLRNGQPFPFVIAIVPAYNEEESISLTIDSLNEQTRRPDAIVVLADNCTDDTISIAESLGVTVVESVGNVDGKAGALNQFLSQLLPILEPDDCILVMDADTLLSPKFIESTVNMLFTQSQKPIAGVGGIFLADDFKWNLVQQLQSNEYTRYRRRLSRRKGRALVLTGTGTVFKVEVLRSIQAARQSGRIPDLGHGHSVYDISALTEDNELTISAKELGYRVFSPKDCTVKTAMMPDLKSLFKQRKRWQRGALENIIAHGLNTHTAPYLIRQFLTYLGVLFLPFYLYTLTIALLQQSEINFLQPLWLLVAIVYLLEQTFSVRKGGWKAVGTSLLVLPEIFLNMFLNIIYVISYFGALFATSETWGRSRHLRAGVEKSKKTQFHEDGISSETHLHGTHEIRQTKRARVLEAFLFFGSLAPVVYLAFLPWHNLQEAWNILTAYVLVGFAATLGRLVPIKTF